MHLTLYSAGDSARSKVGPARLGRPARRPMGWVEPNQATTYSGEVPLLRALAALERAIQAKDPYTMGHSTRVKGYALAMSRRLGMAGGTAWELGLAAQLHDIGKIGVPDELLRKVGRLSAEERRRVLEHTVIGERILAPLMKRRPMVLGVVRWHHERVDGSGYPDGLCGETIPLAARIVSVADAFDAMTSVRPYRAALSVPAASRELFRHAGTQFDPRCVHALLAVWRHESRPLARHRVPAPPVAEVGAVPESLLANVAESEAPRARLGRGLEDVVARVAAAAR